MRFFLRSLVGHKISHTLFVCLFAGICMYLGFLNENDLLDFPPSSFSLKTPYPFPSRQKLVPFPHCEISHLLAIIRHSSRNPTAKNIKRFSLIQAKLANLTFNSEFEWLRNWTNNFTLDDAGELSLSGRVEAMLIGERYRRYGGLFDRYAPDLYQVNSTYKKRTYQTAQAFLTGLFGDKWENEFEITQNGEQDPLLRFFDDCSKYETNIYQNANKRVEEILNSAEFAELIDRVNSLLGTTSLNLSDIDTLWRVCSMEYLATRSSQVCGIFSQQDAQLMEYYYDRRTFLLKSGGYPINVRMSCVLLKHTVSQLRRAVRGEGQKASLYFAHAETLVPLLALLNISTHTVVMETRSVQVPNRSYAYGLLVPMGANLAFNVFRCGKEELLTITLNEQLVLIGESLKSSILLSDFFELTDPLISSCDPTSFCSTSNSN